MVSKEKIELLRQKIDEADAIVVGGASGMSAASGFVFYYQEDDVFRRMAGSLAEKYDRHNMFDLFYDRRPSRGEQWALMLRVIHYIYECYTGETYTVPAGRITRIQGDWRYWQCSRPCHDEIYYNKEKVYRLVREIKDDALPDELIPRCPHCGKELAPWVRGYTFLEGEYYQREMKRYLNFLRANSRRKVLFLELGVGMMTPMFIKEPFMNMTYQFPNAFYATVNPQHAIIPKEIARKSLAISDDIAVTLKQLLGKSTAGMKAFDAKEAFNPSRVY